MATIDRPLTAPGARAPVIVAPRRKGWLASLSLVLLVLALGGSFLIGRATAPQTASPQPVVSETVLPSEVAGPMVTKILEDFVAAVNAGEPTRIASFFAADATLSETAVLDGFTSRGNAEIADRIALWYENGFRLSCNGTALQNGSFVAQFCDLPQLYYGGVNRALWAMKAMWVFELRGGKLQNVWVVR